MSKTKDEITIIFRLGEPYPEIVKERAAKLGLSPNQFARLALVQQLENADLLNLQDEVVGVQRELRRLRSEFESVVVEAADPAAHSV